MKIFLKGCCWKILTNPRYIWNTHSLQRRNRNLYHVNSIKKKSRECPASDNIESYRKIITWEGHFWSPVTSARFLRASPQWRSTNFYNSHSGEASKPAVCGERGRAKFLFECVWIRSPARLSDGEFDEPELRKGNAKTIRVYRRMPELCDRNDDGNHVWGT